MKDLILRAWNHRTKIVGYAGALFGAITVMDQQLVIQLIGQSGLAFAIFVNGLLVALIGHHNTNKAKQ